MADDVMAACESPVDAGPVERGPGWAWVGLVVVLAVIVAIPYAAAGPNFILDDWYALRNAHFDGAFAAAGADQARARPGAWLIYALEFGVLGRHPMLIYVVQAALNVGAAVLLFLVVRRLAGSRLALSVAGLWVLLPNHGSLRVWASTMNIVVALVLLLLGCLLLTRPPTTAVSAAVALTFGASVLSYEATLPAALIALWAIPHATRRPRDLRTVATPLAAPLAALAASAVWIILNWHPAKRVGAWADVGDVLPAHFGWGIANAPAASVLLVGALVAISVSVVRTSFPSFRSRRTQADGLIIAGLAIIVVGTVPFLRYFYAPLGAGDRVNVVASVGAAVTWTGIGLVLWEVRRSVAVVLGVTFAANLAFVGVERDLRYARAGDDVLLTLELLDESLPSPEGPIVIGPVPLTEGNVVGLLDASNVDGALQLHRRTRLVSGYVTGDPESFLRQPPHLRFDQVAALRGGPGVRR